MQRAEPSDAPNSIQLKDASAASSAPDCIIPPSLPEGGRLVQDELASCHLADTGPAGLVVTVSDSVLMWVMSTAMT